MPNRLTDIEVDEVSLVKRGANQKAHIVFWKSEDGPDEDKGYEVDRLAKQLQDQDGDLAHAESVAAVLNQHPELYDPQEGFPVELSKADAWEAERRDTFVDVDRLADQLQVAHRSMTRAEAVAKAVSMRPEVYDKAVLMSAEGPMQRGTAG